MQRPPAQLVSWLERARLVLVAGMALLAGVLVWIALSIETLGGIAFLVVPLFHIGLFATAIFSAHWLRTRRQLPVRADAVSEAVWSVAAFEVGAVLLVVFVPNLSATSDTFEYVLCLIGACFALAPVVTWGRHVFGD